MLAIRNLLLIYCLSSALADHGLYAWPNDPRLEDTNAKLGEYPIDYEYYADPEPKMSTTTKMAPTIHDTINQTKRSFGTGSFNFKSGDDAIDSIQETGGSVAKTVGITFLILICGCTLASIVVLSIVMHRRSKKKEKKQGTNKDNENGKGDRPPEQEHQNDDSKKIDRQKDAEPPKESESREAPAEEPGPKPPQSFLSRNFGKVSKNVGNMARTIGKLGWIGKLKSLRENVRFRMGRTADALRELQAEEKQGEKDDKPVTPTEEKLDTEKDLGNPLSMKDTATQNRIPDTIQPGPTGSTSTVAMIESAHTQMETPYQSVAIGSIGNLNSEHEAAAKASIKQSEHFENWDSRNEFLTQTTEIGQKGTEAPGKDQTHKAPPSTLLSLPPNEASSKKEEPHEEGEKNDDNFQKLIGGQKFRIAAVPTAIQRRPTIPSVRNTNLDTIHQALSLEEIYPLDKEQDTELQTTERNKSDEEMTENFKRIRAIMRPVIAANRNR